MSGTILNIIAVLIGGSIGILLGNRLPKKVQEIVLHGLGLMALVIGVTMAIGTGNILIPLFSVLTGGILGELMRIEDGLNWLGQRAEARWGAQLGQGKVAGWSVPRAFVTSSLILCVGPMTVLGSIRSGILGDHDLLAVKSVLDLFTAIPFAASLGPGVLISAASVAVVQGGLAGVSMSLGGGAGRRKPGNAVAHRTDGHWWHYAPRHRSVFIGTEKDKSRLSFAEHSHRAADRVAIGNIGKSEHRNLRGDMTHPSASRLAILLIALALSGCALCDMPDSVE